MKKSLLAAVVMGSLGLALAQGQSQMMAVTPRLAVASQTISNNTVVIPEVILAQPGFVVIHAVVNGKIVITPPLGVSALLPAGLSTEVPIKLSSLPLGSQQVYAMAHIHGNTSSAYDFPGPDSPVTVGGKILMKEFTLDTVRNQQLKLTKAGVEVIVSKVTLAQPGYVVIHISNKNGGLIVLPYAGASKLLPAGTSYNVPVLLNPNIKIHLGEKLWAMAHIDNGGGVYDFPAGDPPVIRNGKIVMASFTID